MKKISILIFQFFLILWIESVYAQENSALKDIWLINIPTPLTLSRGNIEFDVLGRYTNFSNPDPRTEVADFIFVGNYGLTNNLSLSFIAPFSWISGKPNNFGPDDVSLIFKYNIFHSRKFTVAISPRFFLPTGKKEEFRGVGKINIQANVNLALTHTFFKIFTNLGYGKNGYIVSHEELSPSGSHMIYVSTVKNVEIIAFSSGLAFDISAKTTILLEGIGQYIPEFSDEDFYFQVGGIYRIHKSVLIKSSVGVGLPRDTRTIIDTRAIFGLSYLLNYKNDN